MAPTLFRKLLAYSVMLIMNVVLFLISPIMGVFAFALFLPGAIAVHRL